MMRFFLKRKINRLIRSLFRIISMELEDNQSLELLEKLADFTQESDRDVSKILESFIYQLSKDNFVENLNRHTDSEGSVDWERFLF